MPHLLGIDLGSSSVKVSLVDIDSGACIASAHYPESEAPIKALHPGWAEQRPDSWWEYLKECVNALMRKCASADAITQSHNNAIKEDIVAIGISYQMHGLVCLDKDLQPLRDAIIWCDSRGVPYGERAFDSLGHEYCLSHLLNSPGNFTAAKLAWVKENEPALFDKIRYVMLPGDYLALRLTGVPATTACGLSEMMLWDYSAESGMAASLMDYFGFPKEIIPPLVPTFGEQGRVTEAAAKELGLKAGIPVTYRAGDQPNNALSLNVFNPGEVAATAGTSGVVYGIKESVNAITQSHNNTLINTFLHVKHNLGVMHCVNGCGILNSWMRRTLWPTTESTAPTYEALNDLASTVPAGSEGVSVIPFGNGAERVMGNRDIGASIHGLNFNRHTRVHLLRAAQEGIAFALYYGMEIIENGKLKNENSADASATNAITQSHSNTLIKTIHAGRANMFLSPIFRDTLASISGVTIKLFDTDGSVGAARGAGLGAGIYASTDEAFASLKQLAVIEPRKDYSAPLMDAYQRWKELLPSITK